MGKLKAALPEDIDITDGSEDSNTAYQEYLATWLQYNG